jgi:hypothetical protein
MQRDVRGVIGDITTRAQTDALRVNPLEIREPEIQIEACWVLLH